MPWSDAGLSRLSVHRPCMGRANPARPQQTSSRSRQARRATQSNAIATLKEKRSRPHGGDWGGGRDLLSLGEERRPDINFHVRCHRLPFRNPAVACGIGHDADSAGVPKKPC
jgi:hypothetical protein